MAQMKAYTSVLNIIKQIYVLGVTRKKNHEKIAKNERVTSIFKIMIFWLNFPSEISWLRAFFALKAL